MFEPLWLTWKPSPRWCVVCWGRPGYTWMVLWSEMERWIVGEPGGEVGWRRASFGDRKHHDPVLSTIWRSWEREAFWVAEGEREKEGSRDETPEWNRANSVVALTCWIPFRLHSLPPSKGDSTDSLRVRNTFNTPNLKNITGSQQSSLLSNYKCRYSVSSFFYHKVVYSCQPMDCLGICVWIWNPKNGYAFVCHDRFPLDF